MNDFLAKFGEPERPFPFAHGVYDVLPGMRRFGQAGGGMPAETGHFRIDTQTASYLEQKLEILGRGAHLSRCRVDLSRSDCEALAEVLWQTLHGLAVEQPDWAQACDTGVHLVGLGLTLTDRRASGALAPDVSCREAPLAELGARIAAWLAQQQGLERLADALALGVPEDYCVVRAGPEGEPDGDLAELMHVCFPSSWDPRSKLGADFTAIHRPVANNEVILRGHVSMVRAVCGKGPFVRYAWGVHRDGTLCHNPALFGPLEQERDLSPEAVAAHSVVRVERQTTRPFADLGRGLFTIRTYVEPLREFAQDAERRDALARAIAGMNDAALAYKGLTERGEPLVRWLSESAT
jgi:dimethylamine monooxygenase subunit A